ncbi:C-reactive protein-like isoform X2 [Hemitrygon akajei]|uniref:C-reactive protein-like isoform X2 n=1 Tax=Hemitrygon akajei TaxID=2704970 RepID=UPI003BF95CB6
MRREKVGMFSLISALALLVGVSDISAVSGGLRGKTVIFPQQSSNSYMRLLPNNFPELSAFTLCMRSATELTRSHATISYATPESDNQILFWAPETKGFNLYLMTSEAIFQLPEAGSLHRHLCVSWESETGYAIVWVDGKRSLAKTLWQGHRVKGGGVIILGQDQDEVEGGFDADQSFVGQISQVNLWDRALGDREVAEVMRGCLCSGGNVIDWSTVDFETTGAVEITADPECEL